MANMSTQQTALTNRFLAYIKLQKRYSPLTVGAYVYDLNQFFSYINDTYGEAPIAYIKTIHIRSWRVHLFNKDYDTRSILRKISSLKSFFKFLLKKEVIEQNPMAALPMPKKSQKVPSFLNDMDMQKLFEHTVFTPDFKGSRDRLILELLYGTGMRRAELMNLTRANIDLSGNSIKVVGKGNKERMIPIGSHLKRQITTYLNYCEEKFGCSHENLLLTNKGKKIYPKLVYKTVKKYLGLVTTQQKRSPHVLRHTFATSLLNNGADLNAVKKLLGHSSLMSTQVYTHYSIEKIKKAYQKAHPKAE